MLTQAWLTRGVSGAEARASFRRLEHEHELATQLDAAGAVTPVALTRHEGRAVLILKDPGGELLERVLERNNGRSVDLT